MDFSFKKAAVAVLLAVATLSAAPAMAQVQATKHQTRKLVREYNKAWKQSQKKVKQYAKEHNVPIRCEYPSGKVVELFEILPDGRPFYVQTLNDGAAITTRANELWEGGSVGVSVDGSTYEKKVGVWDGGKALKTHVEFQGTNGLSRVTYGDNGTTTHYHATHVAGTIAARGAKPQAKGMAPNVQVKSYDWSNPVSEMTGQAGVMGMEISNHSWGGSYGWHFNEDSGLWEWHGNSNVSTTEDAGFGYYNQTAQEWDNLAHNYPNFLIVTSAGNDRGEGPMYAGTSGYAEKDGGEDGYDCISHFSLCKNLLTVGAVKECLNYTGPSSVKMTDFSDWGPADDGRIKPDIVAKGYQVHSCIDNNNNSYDTYDGTSMSSPNATGTIVLLQELYKQFFTDPMTSSMAKGLVINTADECGPNDGPDYMYGWGLLNAERAANIIIENKYQDCMTDITYSGTEYSRQFNVTATRPLCITACWTDVKGPVYPLTLNNRQPVLINDIDIRLVDPNGVTHYPYSLDPDNPSAAATTTGPNHVDNVEEIYIANPVAGTYTLYMSHTGAINGGQQVVSLIYNGIDDNTSVPECINGMITPYDGEENLVLTHEIKWEPSMLTTGYRVHFGTDGGGVYLPTNIMNGVDMASTSFNYNLKPDTRYYIAIQPYNQNGVNTECTNIYTFKTMKQIYVGDQPYNEGAESVTIPNLPNGWITENKSATSNDFVSSNFASHGGSNSILLKGSDIFEQDNWLISPIFSFHKDRHYVVKVYMRAYLSMPEDVEIKWGYYPVSDSLSTVVYTNNELDPSWNEIEFTITAPRDGTGVIGIHSKSEQGFGIFVDDFSIQDKYISVSEVAEPTTKVSVANGLMNITLADEVSTAIEVVNSLGQVVLSTTTNSSQTTLKETFTAGVYLVSVSNENIKETIKVIVK